MLYAVTPTVHTRDGEEIHLPTITFADLLEAGEAMAALDADVEFWEGPEGYVVFDWEEIQ